MEVRRFYTEMLFLQDKKIPIYFTIAFKGHIWMVIHICDTPVKILILRVYLS